MYNALDESFGIAGHVSFGPGAAIRGGIPVCWPWFGPHPSDPTLPQHGFARTSEWTVSATACTWTREATSSSQTRCCRDESG